MSPSLSHQTALRRLVLTNFRSYASLRLQVESSLVVFSGPNGAGKTNILEAISLLIPGKGLRKARLGDMAHFSDTPTQWAVAAQLATPSGRVDIGTALERVDGAERRMVKIDGSFVATQGELYENVYVTWLVPQMERMFNEGASIRRKFLDRLVCGLNPEHSKALYRYEHAQRERSKLLKERRFDRQWLDALEDTMAIQGTIVASGRVDLARLLSQACQEGLSGFPKARVELVGEVESLLGAHSSLAVEDNMRVLLAESRQRDGESGTTAHGPHLSDIRVWHLDKNLSANFCSTGEQKALLTTIILGNVRLQTLERGATPILLLDEIVAHLDAHRRRTLFEEIQGLGVQTFMTGTDQDTFEGLDKSAQFFQVRNATLVAA